jgi:isocitrate/isopropylmalate dehydrogenase
MNMKTFNIAVIAGDGIGKEVVPEGIRVLEAAGKRFGFQWKWHEFDWSCETVRESSSGATFRRHRVAAEKLETWPNRFHHRSRK